MILYLARVRPHGDVVSAREAKVGQLQYAASVSSKHSNKTNKHTNKQTNKQTNIIIHKAALATRRTNAAVMMALSKHTDRQTDTHTNTLIHTHTHTDSQTYTHKHTHRQTHAYTQYTHITHMHTAHRSIRMFCGFRSRCRMKSLWHAATPARICAINDCTYTYTRIYRRINTYTHNIHTTVRTQQSTRAQYREHTIHRRERDRATTRQTVGESTYANHGLRKRFCVVFEIRVQILFDKLKDEIQILALENHFEQPTHRHISVALSEQIHIPYDIRVIERHSVFKGRFLAGMLPGMPSSVFSMWIFLMAT